MEPPIAAKHGGEEEQPLLTDIKRSRTWRLAPVLALAVAAVLWLGWQFWVLHGETERIRSQDHRLVELAGRIVHLDEVLTMSARMAAATGDPAWEGRYRGFEPQLDEAIKASSRLDPEILGEFIAQTDAANRRLAAMENRAFELVRRKDQLAASTVLSSPDYERQKQLYADGIRKLTAALNVRTRERVVAQQQRIIVVSATLLCVLTVLSVFWLALLRSGKRQVEAERRARQAMAQAMDQLEGRVAEATADLTVANHRLKEEMAVRRRSEEDLSITLHSIGDAVVATDTDGRVVRMNPVAEQLTGWPLVEAAGRPLAEIFRIVDARTRESVADPLAKALVTGEIVTLANDTVLIARDGAERQIADSAAPIRDVEGGIRGAVLVFHDVTGQYETRKALRERVKELTCLQQVRDSMQAGPSVEQLCRNTVEHLARGMQHPDIAVSVITLDGRRFTSGRSTEGLTHGLHADVEVAGEVVGRLSVFYTEDKPFLLPDEQNLGDVVAAAVSHYLDRKQAEEEKARLFGIIEESPDFIGIADLQGNLLYHNRAARTMVGLPEDAALSHMKIRDMHPGWAGKLVEEEGIPTSLRQGSWRSENALLHRNGSEIPVSQVLVVHRDSSGEPKLISTIMRDITDLKRAETELRLAKTQAEASNVAKGAFLANMSHEIRTPMTAILGFAEMVDSTIECCTECPKHKSCDIRVANKEHIRIIRRNGERLLGLINDILDLSKIEAGRMELARVPCSPVQIVHEAVSLMRVKAIEKGLSLDTRYEFPLPEMILSDPARLREVLVNLAGNAVKFTDTGHVEIVVRCMADVQAGRAVMAFDVKDTGIGMTSEQIGRLFQPFAQVGPSTTRQHGGTGLGLAISKRLAEALGGGIAVESRPGEGSTFTFTVKTELPEPVCMLNDLSEAARPSHKPHSSPPAARLRGRVLLAEDGLDNQKLLSAILRKAGAQVDLASNGRVAVEKALSARSAGEPYDAILMDMRMPEMDGYQATRQLRQSGYEGVIIALTAHAMLGDREECLAAGCDDYATKPVDRMDLLNMLGRVMGCSTRGPGDDPAAGAPAQAHPDEAIRSEFADDPDLADILDEFVARLPGALETMSESLANNDHEELRRLAHQVKGAGGGYGYPLLTEQARKLENAAKAGDVEAARLVLNELQTLSRAVIAGHRENTVSEGKER